MGALVGVAVADQTAPATVHSVDEALQAGPGDKVVHGGSLNFRGGSAPVLAFDFGVESPRDAATGQASGKRQHSPITIVREVDSASPLLYAGLAAGTVSVLTGSDTYILYGVSVVSTGRFIVAGAAAADTHELERISLMFQRIEISNLLGKKAATDDWSTGGSPTPTPSPRPKP